MLHRQQKRKTKDYTDDRDKLIEDDDGWEDPPLTMR
jgi:hypothetical protein